MSDGYHYNRETVEVILTRLDRTTPGVWHIAGMPTIPALTEADIDFVAHAKENIETFVSELNEISEAIEQGDNERVDLRIEIDDLKLKIKQLEGVIEVQDAFKKAKPQR
jgi:hypothetical protein